MVLKAVHRSTRNKCAIKRIKCSFNDMNYMRYILREITILRQLTQMQNNKYSPKLLDILVYGKDDDICKLNCIFLVTEYVPGNLR